MTRDEIYKKVQGVLVDALGVDEDEVTPTATLRGDLGAESIDFLDIVFRLEKAFGIKIPRGEMFPEDLFTNAAYVQNGRITPADVVEFLVMDPEFPRAVRFCIKSASESLQAITRTPSAEV